MGGGVLGVRHDQEGRSIIVAIAVCARATLTRYDGSQKRAWCGGGVAVPHNLSLGTHVRTLSVCRPASQAFPRPPPPANSVVLHATSTLQATAIREKLKGDHFAPPVWISPHRHAARSEVWPPMFCCMFDCFPRGDGAASLSQSHSPQVQPSP